MFIDCSERTSAPIDISIIIIQIFLLRKILWPQLCTKNASDCNLQHVEWALCGCDEGRRRNNRPQLRNLEILIIDTVKCRQFS